jgi:glycosyltransferase involved in cell wall biosynthesis
MNISVTVVVPAYNAAQYLSETIESVLAQTFNDFELLVIDDGSTDNTAVIAHQYSQQDSRV